MPTKTAPTIDQLQAQITKLERRNEKLEEENHTLGSELSDAQERLQETQEVDERRTDRARQVVVDHHDDQRHPGPQRFCAQAPCPALNDLLDGGGL